MYYIGLNIHVLYLQGDAIYDSVSMYYMNKEILYLNVLYRTQYLCIIFTGRLYMGLSTDATYLQGDSI